MSESERLKNWLLQALAEDLGADGDLSSRSAIPEDMQAEAILWQKQDGILAGIGYMESLFRLLDSSLNLERFAEDGQRIPAGTKIARIRGSVHSILAGERLVLNIMQRMSGIATYTRHLLTLMGDSPTRILDTRKTTPLFRYFEKEAVRIGGGYNHRFGLYDMVMLKDNHVDAAGGIQAAITRSKAWLAENGFDRKIEVETRNLEEVQEVLAVGGVDRIMFDNFSPEMVKRAVKLVKGSMETEASGGITEKNLREYAETGVQFISVGALTHSAPALDLSLKIALK